MPSNETALILSAIEGLREDGRVRDGKLDEIREAMPGLTDRVGALETKVSRHQYGGILVALLMAAGIFGEGAKTALMKLLGVH